MVSRSDISPELVLVDPDLAQLARAVLGPPGELPPHARSVVTPTYARPAARDRSLVPPAPFRPRLAPVDGEPQPAAAAEPTPTIAAAPVPGAIVATAAPSPEPVPVRPAAARVAEPTARPRRRGGVVVATLLAASLALNAALAWEIIRSAGQGPRVTVVGGPAAKNGSSAPAQRKAAPSPTKTQPSSTVKTAQTPQTAKSSTQNTQGSTKQTKQQGAGLANGGTTPAKTKPARPSTPAKRPKAAPGQAATSLALSWDAAEGATFYNVVLWRDSKRLLDLWPTSPNVRIPSAWTYRGRNWRLEPGRYLWFAFAGYGAGADRRVGARVASGDVVVQPD